MAITAPDSVTSWKPLTSEEKKNIKGAISVAKPVYETVTTTVAAPAASGGGDNGYSEYKALLEQMKREKQAQVNAAFNQGKESLDNARAAANKDAYIAYMHGLKNMPQRAALGGNGGYAQSLATKQQLNYENNRGSIYQNYLDNLRELEAAKANGIVAANQDYLTDMAGLIKSGAPAAAAGNETTTTNNVWGGKYKVGSKTMSRDEYLAYLAGYGMDAAQAAEYMQKNNIPY